MVADVTKQLVVGLMVVIATHPALAAKSSGYAALAFGAIIGGYSPVLSVENKTRLAQLVSHKTSLGSVSGAITINADSIICHAGNVDIAAFGCELTFGTKKVTLSGRRAIELFAVIGELGVPGDGAAGTIYQAMHNVSCTIRPSLIARKDGSGADCRFDPGPA
jgi:hypothetical protein